MDLIVHGGATENAVRAKELQAKLTSAEQRIAELESLRHHWREHESKLTAAEQRVKELEVERAKWRGEWDTMREELDQSNAELEESEQRERVLRDALPDSLLRDLSEGLIECDSEILQAITKIKATLAATVKEGDVRSRKVWRECR